MVSIFVQIFRCVLFPYGLILLLFPVCLRKKNYYYGIFFAIICCSVTWRLFFKLTSSRYCAFFFIILTIVSSILLKGLLSSHKKSIVFLTIFLLYFNVIHCFSGYRNIYIFDIKDIISKKNSDGEDIAFFIDQKDFQRFHSDDNHSAKELPIEDSNLTLAIHQYEFWKNDAVFWLHESFSPNQKKQSINTLIKDDKEICRFFTNSKQTKKYSAFLKKKTKVPIYTNQSICQDKRLSSVINKGNLKSCDLEYDFYVFQYDENLFWFIGYDIEQENRIIYHIETDNPEMLPEHRKKYNFDARTFRTGSKFELDRCGNYRVFCCPIPTEYPVSFVRVGLNIDGKIIFTSAFYVDPF